MFRTIIPYNECEVHLLLVQKFVETHSFHRVLGNSPKNLWKLYVSIKFPHQEIRWNFDILRSSSNIFYGFFYFSWGDILLRRNSFLSVRLSSYLCRNCLQIFGSRNMVRIFYFIAWNYHSSMIISRRKSYFESTHRPRTAATSKMERLVIIINGWKPLTIIAMRSILDVAAALGLSLKTILVLCQGLEAPYRVISILWINSKQPSNSGYTSCPRLRIKFL